MDYEENENEKENERRMIMCGLAIICVRKYASSVTKYNNYH